MAQKQFKIGLSNTDKQNMAQDVYERVLALAFNEYDTTTEYEVGDFVVYNDQLYKCISATSGAWDSSKWQLATLNDLVDDIENAVAFVNDKANVDGNYPTMTVGAADNLTPYDEDSGVDQEQPFLLQGTGCGNGEQQVDTGALGLLKEKQGNTVVVNQLANLQNNKYSLSGHTVGAPQFEKMSSVNAIAGHKYLIYYLTDDDISNGKGQVYWDGNSETKYYISKNGEIYTQINTDTQDLRIALYDTYEKTTFDATVYVIDLTQWFGSNDNIPAHLLAHPENFLRYYQGNLAYNTGELVNANSRYVKCIGRNQWDEVVEAFGQSLATGTGSTYNNPNAFVSSRIKVIPNAYYCKYNGSGNQTLYYCFYDKDNNFIEGSGFSNTPIKAPANAYWLRFSVQDYGTTYNHDITISLYYEGESGYDQYYPYEELTNNDTGTETLRSAGSIKDSKAPDGTITRRVGNRAYQSGDENDSSLITDGTTTNYPLAEPTTEQGTPYSENLVIDDFGSMDFEGTNGVPQGNLIFYPVDYKAFIDTLYNYTDGTPSNIALKSDLAVVNEKIGAKIPECPTTTDGTYVLKATVSDGTVVYNWVLEE